MRDTQAATALPPATAYGMLAFSSAAVARNIRSRTFSTAPIIRSQETGPMSTMIVIIASRRPAAKSNCKAWPFEPPAPFDNPA